MLSPSLIEDLKLARHYFAAGAVAASIGGGRFYGCHVGMKSEKEQAQRLFFAGFDAAMNNQFKGN